MIDINEADELLMTTRAVRRRLDLERPVPRELLLECVTVAQQAPTAGNQQGWGFVIVTDPEIRQKIADIYREAGAEYLAQAGKNAQDPQTKRVYESAVYLTEVLHRVPAHVFPCIEGR